MDTWDASLTPDGGATTGSGLQFSDPPDAPLERPSEAPNPAIIPSEEVYVPYGEDARPTALGTSADARLVFEGQVRRRLCAVRPLEGPAPSANELWRRPLMRTARHIATDRVLRPYFANLVGLARSPGDRAAALLSEVQGPGSLLDALESGARFTPRLAALVVADVLFALDALHTRGVSHGGVCARKVYVGPQRPARLFLAGRTRTVARAAEFPAARRAQGLAGPAPPEWDGPGAVLLPAADVFFAGVLLLQLALSQPSLPPLNRDQLAAVVAAATPRITHSVAQVVTQCITVSPMRRPTAEAAASALYRFALSVPAAPLSPHASSAAAAGNADGAGADTGAAPSVSTESAESALVPASPAAEGGDAAAEWPIAHAAAAVSSMLRSVAGMRSTTSMHTAMAGARDALDRVPAQVRAAVASLAEVVPHRSPLQRKHLDALRAIHKAAARGGEALLPGASHDSGAEQYRSLVDTVLLCAVLDTLFCPVSTGTGSRAVHAKAPSPILPTARATAGEGPRVRPLAQRERPYRFEAILAAGTLVLEPSTMLPTQALSDPAAVGVLLSAVAADNTNTVIAAAHVIQRMATLQSTKALAIEAGAVRVLARVLDQHLCVEETAREVSGALATLVYRGRPKACLEDVHAALPVTLRLLKQYGHHNAATEQGGATLIGLALVSPEARQFAVEAGALDVIWQLLRRHRAVDFVATTLMGALGVILAPRQRPRGEWPSVAKRRRFLSLKEEEEDDEDDDADRGPGDPMMERMRERMRAKGRAGDRLGDEGTDGDDQVDEHSGVYLRVNATAGAFLVPTLPTVTTAAASPEVLLVMIIIVAEEHSTNDLVSEQAVSAIAHICAAKPQLLAGKHGDNVGRAMGALIRNNASVAPFGIAACAALRTIATAARPVLLRKLLESATFRALCDLLRARLDSPATLEAGLDVLACLIYPATPQAHSGPLASALAATLTVLRRHPRSEPVARAGAVALASIIRSAAGSPIARSSSALDQLAGLLRDHMHRATVAPWILAAITNAVRAHTADKPLSAPLEDLPSTLQPLFTASDLGNDTARWLCTVLDAVLPFPGQARRCAEAEVPLALCDLLRTHVESGYVCAAALSALSRVARLLPRETFEQAAAAGLGELLPVVVVRCVHSPDVVMRAAALCTALAAGDPGFRAYAMRHSLAFTLLPALRTHLGGAAARAAARGALEAVWDPRQQLPSRLQPLLAPLLLAALLAADAGADAAEVERAEACARAFGVDPRAVRQTSDGSPASLGASVDDEFMRRIDGGNGGGGRGEA